MSTGTNFEQFEQELNRLVTAFGQRFAEFKQPGYAEVQLRDDFLSSFFRALWWDMETRYSKRTKWKLDDFSKTCYAARLGADHFIACHLRVIRLLDYWREAGVRVEVHDETGYWGSRSREMLVSEVASYCAYLQSMGVPVES